MRVWAWGSGRKSGLGKSLCASSDVWIRERENGRNNSRNNHRLAEFSGGVLERITLVQPKRTLFAALTALAAATGIAAVSQPASARVVCNRFGDCWSTHERLRYPPELGVRVYSDRFADRRYRDHRWRRYHRNWHDEGHHRDRGAYRNGVWFTF